jgi:hypothetical protein
MEHKWCALELPARMGHTVSGALWSDQLGWGIVIR